MGRPALTQIVATIRALIPSLTLALLSLSPGSAAAAEAPLPVQRPLAEGTVDWTNGRVEAQGVASPRVISPHTDWMEGDLRKRADERSVRNLRETVAALPYDTARTAGELLGEDKLVALAEQAKESFRETLTDGTALRRVWLPLDLVRVALGVERKPPPPPDAGVVLVVEARGAGLNPAFRMRLLDASEAAIWQGEARYVSSRPQSLRKAPVLKLSGVRGARSTDALLDQASHVAVHKLPRPIADVWVVTDSWVKR